MEFIKKQRQMDMYQWIVRKNGFNVSDVGYFLYVTRDQHFENGMRSKGR